jgi:hypothetical protein
VTDRETLVTGFLLALWGWGLSAPSQCYSPRGRSRFRSDAPSMVSVRRTGRRAAPTALTCAGADLQNHAGREQCPRPVARGRPGALLIHSCLLVARCALSGEWGLGRTLACQQRSAPPDQSRSIMAIPAWAGAGNFSFSTVCAANRQRPTPASSSREPQSPPGLGAPRGRPSLQFPSSEGRHLRRQPGTSRDGSLGAATCGGK